MKHLEVKKKMRTIGDLEALNDVLLERIAVLETELGHGIPAWAKRALGARKTPRKILFSLASKGHPMSVKELYDCVDAKGLTVRKRLSELTQEGLLNRVSYGVYCLAEEV